MNVAKITTHKWRKLCIWINIHLLRIFTLFNRDHRNLQKIYIFHFQLMLHIQDIYSDLNFILPQ